MPSSETRLEYTHEEKGGGEEEDYDNVPVQRASFIESSDSISESVTSDLMVEKYGYNVEREDGQQRQISNCINNDNNNESSYTSVHQEKVNVMNPGQEMMVVEEEDDDGLQSELYSRKENRIRKNPDLKDPSQRNGFASYLNHSPVNHSSILGQSRTKISQ